MSYFYLRIILKTLESIMMLFFIITMAAAFLFAVDGQGTPALVIGFVSLYCGSQAGTIKNMIGTAEINGILTANTNLDNLRKEASFLLDMKDRQAFLLTQKKIMLISASLILRSIEGLDERDRTEPIDKIGHAMMGMLSIIAKLDEEAKRGN